MAKLTSLTRLSISLGHHGANDLASKELADLIPFVSCLPLLETLSLIGLDLHKQDLGCISALTKLRRLSHLDVRGAFLPYATFKTVARGVRGSVSLQSRTLASLSSCLHSLSLPDNTLVGDDAMMVNQFICHVILVWQYHFENEATIS